MFKSSAARLASFRDLHTCTMQSKATCSTFAVHNRNFDTCNILLQTDASAAHCRYKYLRWAVPQPPTHLIRHEHVMRCCC